MKTLLPIVAILLGGCSTEDAKEAVAKSVAPKETVEMAGKAVRTDGIAMTREGNAVRVGDAWESALKVWPERRGAYRLRSLPERFGSEYEGHGWETNEGQGYGVITRDDQVVAAIYHADGVEADYAQSLVAAQRVGTGSLPLHDVANGKSAWKYWESGSQRLMVLLHKGAKGTDVTILMGDAKVLDALGATKPAPAASPATAPFLTHPPDPPGDRT